MPNYKFFLVAPGKVGQALGKLLQQKNHTCIGLWSRHPNSAQEAATFLSTTPHFGQPFPQALQEADIVLLTAPERVIPSLSEALFPLLKNGAVLLHTAGSLPPANIPAKLPNTVHSGVLHPLQSIASASAGVQVIPGSFMAVSGDRLALPIATQLAHDLGGTPVQISHPVLYHLGAVMASNTLYPLFAAACSLLERAGVSPDIAPQMLLPLLRGSVENIAKFGASRGMTGPIARADAATIARHLEALHDDPDMKELYRALAKRAVPLAEEAGADSRGLQAIDVLLEEP